MQGASGQAATAQDDAGWAAVRRAAEELGPGWRALQAGAALPHPWLLLREESGIAVIGLGPDGAAVATVRRVLEEAGFARSFGGHPPIVYRPLPPPEVPLSEVVEAAFALEPPPKLPARAGSWAEAAIAALTSPAMVPPCRPATPAPAIAIAARIDPPAVVPVAASPPSPAPPAAQPRRSRVVAAILLAVAGLVVAAGAWQAQHSEERLPEILAAWLSALLGR